MKKTYPLYRLVIAAILLLSRAVVADNDPAAVNNHCLDHARKVVDDLHREVFNDMTADQSRQTESLIIENCLHQFIPEKNTAAKTAGATEEVSDDDWFTRYVLEGEGADKPGNRRLERLRRR